MSHLGKTSRYGIMYYTPRHSALHYACNVTKQRLESCATCSTIDPTLQRIGQGHEVATSDLELLPPTATKRGQETNLEMQSAH